MTGLATGFNGSSREETLRREVSRQVAAALVPEVDAMLEQLIEEITLNR